MTINQLDNPKILENMNTTENNKLIAEFMGVKLKVLLDTDNMCFERENSWDIIHVDDFIVNGGCFAYHTNWDRLMEVVEKIEKLDYVSVYTNKTHLGEFSIEITYDTLAYKYVQNKKTVFIKDKTLSKIESVYNACVEFIKWYNVQSK